MHDQMTLDKKNLFDTITLWIIRLLFIASFLIFANANINHYTLNLNPDIASETILSRELARNSFILPSTWVSSTEKRVIAPANLASFIYAATGNMNMSMGIACTIYAALLYGFMTALFHSCGLREEPLLIASGLPFLLSTDTSFVLTMHILYAGYYISALASMFLTLIVRIRWLDRDRPPVSGIVVSSLLSFIMGIQGMRGLLTVYLPLVATELVLQLVFFIYDRKKVSLYPLIWTVCMALLSRMSSGLSGTAMSDTVADIALLKDRLIYSLIPSYSNLLKSDGGNVFRYTVLFIVIAGLLYSLFFFIKSIVVGTRDKTVHDEKCLYVLLTLWMSFCAMAAALCVTEMEITYRYGIMLFFASAFGYALLIRMLKGIVCKAAIIPVIVCCVISLRFNYNNLIRKQENAFLYELRMVSEWMKLNGFERGYATFDFASVITVLSNDEVNVYPINNYNELKGSKWLANASWYAPYTDVSGEALYIVSQESQNILWESLTERGITPVRLDMVGNYILVVTDRDITVWEW